MVPEGAEPGTTLTFALPSRVARKAAARRAGGGGGAEAEAAVRIQAVVRGQSARRMTAHARPIQLAATPQLESAALKLQSSFRGHTVRNDQQERARLAWFNYHLQPEVGEWEKAMELAVTPEEQARVSAAKAGIHYEEERRLKWLKHYTQVP